MTDWTYTLGLDLAAFVGLGYGLGAHWLASRYRTKRNALQIERDQLAELADDSQAEIEKLRRHRDALQKSCGFLAHDLKGAHAALRDAVLAREAADNARRAHMREIGRRGNTSPKRHRKPAVMQGDTVN